MPQNADEVKSLGFLIILATLRFGMLEVELRFVS